MVDDGVLRTELLLLLLVGFAIAKNCHNCGLIGDFERVCGTQDELDVKVSGFERVILYPRRDGVYV